MTTTEPRGARLTIDYPDRQLDRLSTALRLFYVLPIVFLLGLIGSAAASDGLGPSQAGCWSCPSR